MVVKIVDKKNAGVWCARLRAGIPPIYRKTTPKQRSIRGHQAARNSKSNGSSFFLFSL